MQHINIPDVGIVYVRVGTNLKYLSLKVKSDNKVWLNIPYGTSKQEVYEFIEKNKTWIINAQNKMKSHISDVSTHYEIGSIVETKFYKLHILISDRECAYYRSSGSDVYLYLVDDTDIQSITKQVLDKIYKKESLRYLPSRLDALAKKYGFKYGRVSTRNNVSNWGSCSSDDNISLNIQLMKLPCECIDYVILHELCHTVEKNHSDKFWELVERVCPNYKLLKQQISKYSTRF